MIEETGTIKELLEYLRQEIISRLDNEYLDGMCLIVDDMSLRSEFTSKERRLLMSYIQDNRPSMFNSWSAFVSTITGQEYFWKQGELKPRIKWLDKHIKKNS